MANSKNRFSLNFICNFVSPQDEEVWQWLRPETWPRWFRDILSSKEHSIAWRITIERKLTFDWPIFFQVRFYLISECNQIQLFHWIWWIQLHLMESTFDFLQLVMSLDENFFKFPMEFRLSQKANTSTLFIYKLNYSLFSDCFLKKQLVQVCKLQLTL